MAFRKKKKEGDSFDVSTLSSTELEVLIRNADTVVFEGKAQSVSSMNDYGTFDILPRHIDYITTLEEIITITQVDGQKKEIPVDRGILRVYRNKVDVFLGLDAVKPQIDVEEVAEEEAKEKEEEEKKKK